MLTGFAGGAPELRFDLWSVFRDVFGEGIAQADGPVKNQLAIGGVRIEAEIALPLELYRRAAARVRKRGFDPRVAEHFQGIRIEVRGEILAARWIRLCEQRIV